MLLHYTLLHNCECNPLSQPRVLQMCCKPCLHHLDRRAGWHRELCRHLTAWCALAAGEVFWLSSATRRVSVVVGSECGGGVLGQLRPDSRWDCGWAGMEQEVGLGSSTCAGSKSRSWAAYGITRGGLNCIHQFLELNYIHQFLELKKGSATFGQI